MPKPYRKSLLSFLLPRLGREPPQPVSKLSIPMFQGVSIHAGPKACGAVKQVDARRFLAKSVPALPLAGCGIPGQCQCRYVKYKERRSDARRLVDCGLTNSFFDGAERRSSQPRRKVD
jgi:hypothetical protein